MLLIAWHVLRFTSDRREDKWKVGPYNSNLSEGAIYKHNNLRGHAMDLQNPTKVFQSDCSFTRETVEAALMFIAPTIKNNTASASTNSNQMVASMICKSTKFDW